MTKKIIPVAKPWLGEEEADAARRVILSGWVTQGSEVRLFEQEFAEYTGASYACAVSSCTAALHLALLTVGVKPGDEVITVSHSFIATANSCRYCGATPVFIDIDPDTFNLNPDLIAAAVTDKTAAILVVHQMGMPANMELIMDIAGKYHLPVVEDAACAIGSDIKYHGQWHKTGAPLGDVACFSFHPRKLLTTGDGGMITTKNPEYDQHFRLLRQHGMNVPDTVRHSSNSVIFESYDILGYNFRMTDIQAAVGRIQLGRIDQIINERRKQREIYCQLQEMIPTVTLPVEPEYARSNWQSYCVRLPDSADQRRVMQFMLDHGISCRRGIMCAHRESAYSDRNHPYSLSESEQAQDHCIILPLYHGMKPEEQREVIECLKAALE